LRRARGPGWRVVPGRRQDSNAGARSARGSFASLLDPVVDISTLGAWPWATSGFSHPKSLTHVDNRIYWWPAPPRRRMSSTQLPRRTVAKS
jgi:hypothetical protein